MRIQAYSSRKAWELTGSGGFFPAAVSTDNPRSGLYNIAMRVVYLDSLLFFELVSDLMLLWAAGKLCQARRRKLRLLAAAGLGAAYTLLSLLWPPAASAPGKASALCAMLLAAYGREKGLWRLGLAFLAMCAVYAGAASAVIWTSGRASLRALVFALGISLGVCALPFRFSGRRGGRARLRLVCGGRSIELTALRDTGNRLREPLSGGPALIAEERTLLPLLEPEVQAQLLATAGLPAPERLTVLGPGFRLLPYRTLGGNGLLLAFRPEQVYIDGALSPGVWAALSPEPLQPGDGCAALLGGDE